MLSMHKEVEEDQESRDATTTRDHGRCKAAGTSRYLI